MMDDNSNKQHLFTTTSFDIELSTLNNQQQSNKLSICQQSQDIGSLNPFNNPKKIKKQTDQCELTPKTLSSYQEFLPTLSSLPTFNKSIKSMNDDKRYLFDNSKLSKNTLLYKQILQKALNVKEIEQQQQKVNPNIGISILDNEGNFIWADSKTQCLLGTKVDNKSMTKNLFKLMISFSKFHLLKKFMGQSILQGKKNSIRFRYLIYSLDCKNKFIRRLKKIGLKQIRLGKQHKFYKQQILYKYLKVLSSEAIKVNLKIPQNLLLNKQLIQKYNIKFDENLEKNIFLDLQKKKNIVNGNYVFKGIILKTRLGQSCPDYDYQLLQKDEKIKKFDEQVEKSIGHH